MWGDEKEDGAKPLRQPKGRKAKPNSGSQKKYASFSLVIRQLWLTWTQRHSARSLAKKKGSGAIGRGARGAGGDRGLRDARLLGQQVHRGQGRARLGAGQHASELPKRPLNALKIPKTPLEYTKNSQNALKYTI